jgi:hypothetical protein
MEEPKFTLEREWTAHGLLCRVAMNHRMGNRVAYVRVQEGHPFYGVDRQREIALHGNRECLKELLEAPHEASMDGVLAFLMDETEKYSKTPNAYLRVHGGLGWSSSRSGGPNTEAVPGEWWFGWDGGHRRDYMVPPQMLLREFTQIWIDIIKDTRPEQAEDLRTYVARVELGEVERDPVLEARLHDAHYWTLADMVAETELLAEQLSLIGLLGVEKNPDK